MSNKKRYDLNGKEIIFVPNKLPNIVVNGTCPMCGGDVPNNHSYCSREHALMGYKMGIRFIPRNRKKWLAK